jgi:uncharacterized protein (TIGR03066 family)
MNTDKGIRFHLCFLCSLPVIAVGILGCEQAGSPATNAATRAEKEAEIDPAKLVGRWEDKEPGVKQKFIEEFTKEGKFKSVRSIGDKEAEFEGTYKVEGNKLICQLKLGSKETENVRTIEKLTDEEFTYSASFSNSEKRTKTLTRIKTK